jgi:CRISPR-associated protein Csd1
MILQALSSYYNRVSQEGNGEVVPEGFEKREIPFLVVLDRKGYFKTIEDTREIIEKKKRARSFIVPKAVKKSVNIAANLLWGNPAYVFGCSKKDGSKTDIKLAKRAEMQVQSFIEKIKDTFTSSLKDEGITAVLLFLETGEFQNVFTHPSWKEIEETGANLTFRLEDETELICQSAAVRRAIGEVSGKSSEDGVQICLISGEMDSPARLHSPIKGVWGAQTSGANIVSFNLDAFNSFGKTQGFNSPIGKKAEHAYTTALNTLLAKGSRQRIQVGDATTVFWAEKNHKMEEWFAEFFSEPSKEQKMQDFESIKALFSAPITGAPPIEEDYTKFFILGLSPNASRLAIRFWHEGTVGSVAKNIKQHFEDCSIDHAPYEAAYPSLYQLLRSTAVQEKSENIQPNLSGDLMNSILNGTPYPQTLFASVLRRIRAEQSKKDINGKTIQNVSYQRASLIKAFLVRDARYYKKEGKEVISVSLDKENKNPGYLLGRLFAVLERIQEIANPGINATIRDRFYGSASSRPATAFPNLLTLKNHHISKMENRGMAINLEKLMGDIVDGVQNFPNILNLQGQGRFAIGYYHQRQDFFKKKEQ